MKYTTINIQGNLISEDILKKIEEGTATGQQAKDFGLDSATQLRGEIEYAWSKIKLEWKYFSERMQTLPPADPYGTSLARKWVGNFFSALNYNLSLRKSSLLGDNSQYYSISHTCDLLDELPVHIVGFNEPSSSERNTLDIKVSGGTSRFSPHGTMQEYLNVTEHLYGMVTNGISLRLMRDSGRLIKLVFIEFDLRRMLEEDKYSEFTVLFRLLHSSRFPKNKQEADQCILEKYFQESIESGNRIRDGLSRAVEESLISLGTGLLQHEKNNELRQNLLEKKITPKDYYRQILRLIYRLLFLMVTEERDLIYDPEDQSDDMTKKKRLYFDHYSIARLRRLCRLHYLYESQFDDLWQGLITTLRLFEENGGGEKLGIQPLAGELFSRSSVKDLAECLLNNHLLLQAIRNLNEFEDDKKNLVSINYRALDVEELGSVYEGLLELHPVIENLEASNSEQIRFLFHEGTDRKTTGSYYTRPDLVNELIKSALIPVIKERLKQNEGNIEAQEKALLGLKVCDPAAGSGHMLLAASRAIAWQLACLRSGENNPGPSVYRLCLREVIQHCIYGVDMNPDAVELCKLSLWLESHNSGKPISFLDHKIRCGNSLIGVTDLGVLKKGIPDDAFNPVTGDDKDICKELKKANASFRKTGQFTLFDNIVEEDELKHFSSDYSDLERINQDDLNTVKKVQEKFEHFRRDQHWLNEWTACNIWTSAFFYNYNIETKLSAPSSERLKIFFKNPAAGYGPMVGKGNAIAMENQFFHWPLEFPDVFQEGGFDLMLGNPPWERIKLQQEEFFATRDMSITEAPNAAARNRLIKNLPVTNPSLFAEYQRALHSSDSSGKFLRDSGRNVLTAIGDINTYSVFAENFYSLIRENGRAAFIIPTGIATDDSNKIFFSNLIESNRLVSLFDFENREAVFPGVHRSYKFCLLSIAGKDIGNIKAQFGFSLTRVEHMQEKLRIFTLSKDDFSLINPNTKTCPVFRTNKDADLTIKVLKRVGVFVNEANNINPWGAFYIRLVDLGDHQDEIELVHLRDDKIHIYPIYEAKLFWQMDHRFSTFSRMSDDDFVNGNARQCEVEEKENPLTRVVTRYYATGKLYSELINKYPDYRKSFFIVWRDISNSTNERSSIASIISKTLATRSCPGIGFNINHPAYLLISNLNSIVYDYFVRQKISGVHFNWGLLKQTSVLAPLEYAKDYKNRICASSIELIYSSWDIKAFADDVWKNADEEIRKLIRRQWEKNKVTTGGHEWDPPEWCEIDKDGCPLPPFKWDEDRRAVLKAELDAIYAKLYGLTTDELRYILDPQDVYGPDFPGETFRVLKEKEIRNYGEYRTKRLVMEAWEKLNNSII